MDMASKKYNTSNGDNRRIGSLSVSESLASILDYGDLVLDEEPLKVEEEKKDVVISPVEIEEAPKAEPEKEKQNTKQKEKKSEPKKQTAARAKKQANEEMKVLGKRGRKKICEDAYIAEFAKCGDDTYNKMIECRYKEKKFVNEYMIDLMKREKAAYEKNPQGYVDNRRKKAEQLYKVERSGKGSVYFKATEELAAFIEDILFEIRCSKELFIRTAIEIDYEKLNKK